MKIKTAIPFIFALSLYSCSQDKNPIAPKQEEVFKQNLSALESFVVEYEKIREINPEKYTIEGKELSEEVKRFYWNLKGWIKTSLDGSVNYALGEESWE